MPDGQLLMQYNCLNVKKGNIYAKFRYSWSPQILKISQQNFGRGNLTPLLNLDPNVNTDVGGGMVAGWEDTKTTTGRGVIPFQLDKWSPI